MKQHTLLIFYILLKCFQCSKLPSTFKKCNIKQKDFNSCLSIAIKDAVHQLTEPKEQFGLPQMEPLEVPSMVIDAGSGAVQFQQNYSDLKINNLTKIDHLVAELDLEENVLTLHLEYPDVVLVFDYEIHGKMLLLPIFGDGPGSIVMMSPDFVLKFFLEEYEKKNKKFYKVTNTTLLMKPQLIHFELENLFNGNKVLGDNVLQVMNDNWEEVFADVKPSYEEAFSQIFMTIFNNLLSRISVSNLFDDEE